MRFIFELSESHRNPRGQLKKSRFEMCTGRDGCMCFPLVCRVFWGIFSLRRTNALNRADFLRSEVVARSQCIK